MIDWIADLSTQLGRIVADAAQHRTSLWVPDLGGAEVLAASQPSASPATHAWEVRRLPGGHDYLVVDYASDSPFERADRVGEPMGGTLWVRIPTDHHLAVAASDWPAQADRFPSIRLPDGVADDVLRVTPDDRDPTRASWAITRYPDTPPIFAGTSPPDGLFGGRSGRDDSTATRGTLYIELTEPDVRKFRAHLGHYTQTSLFF